MGQLQHLSALAHGRSLIYPLDRRLGATVSLDTMVKGEISAPAWKRAISLQLSHCADFLTHKYGTEFVGLSGIKTRMVWALLINGLTVHFLPCQFRHYLDQYYLYHSDILFSCQACNWFFYFIWLYYYHLNSLLVTQSLFSIQFYELRLDKTSRPYISDSQANIFIVATFSKIGCLWACSGLHYQDSRPP